MAGWLSVPIDEPLDEREPADPHWQDEVDHEVAAGRACGTHDRPLPCLKCA